MKKLLYLMLAAAVIGGAVGYYLWNKPHENMMTAKADATVDAATMFADFEKDEAAANAKYLGKTVAVTGKVKEASTGADGTTKINLEAGPEATFGVACTLDPLSKHARTTFAPGETVTLKGKCIGLNLDVQLDRCVEVK